MSGSVPVAIKSIYQNMVGFRILITQLFTPWLLAEDHDPERAFEHDDVLKACEYADTSGMLIGGDEVCAGSPKQLVAFLEALCGNPPAGDSSCASLLSKTELDRAFEFSVAATQFMFMGVLVNVVTGRFAARARSLPGMGALMEAPIEAHPPSWLDDHLSELGSPERQDRVLLGHAEAVAKLGVTSWKPAIAEILRAAASVHGSPAGQQRARWLADDVARRAAEIALPPDTVAALSSLLIEYLDVDHKLGELWADVHAMANKALGRTPRLAFTRAEIGTENFLALLCRALGVELARMLAETG